MTVWVVMGNDFPAAVFSTAMLAQQFVDRMKAREASKKSWERRIYWSSNTFELDKEE